MIDDKMNMAMLALLGSILNDGRVAKAGSDRQANLGASAILMELAEAGYILVDSDRGEILMNPTVLKIFTDSRPSSP